MSDCVFCRIAAGAIRADVIYQDDLVVAFVDTHPIRPGHALIIPREHVPFFEDLPAASASRITEIGQGLARALKSLMACPGSLPSAAATSRIRTLTSCPCRRRPTSPRGATSPRIS